VPADIPPFLTELKQFIIFSGRNRWKSGKLFGINQNSETDFLLYHNPNYRTFLPISIRLTYQSLVMKTIHGPIQ
jgi:hypothetical protein